MVQTGGWDTFDSRQGDKAVKPVKDEPPAAVRAYVEQVGSGTDQAYTGPTVDCAPWQQVDVGGVASAVDAHNAYSDTEGNYAPRTPDSALTRGPRRMTLRDELARSQAALNKLHDLG
jgi:hypothetical protein